VLAICLIASLRSAQAFTAETVQHGANRYTVVHVDPKSETLHLYLADEAQKPFKGFDRLASWLSPRGETLAFAMNACMYEKNFSPVGLYVGDGKELSPLNTQSGRGNFYLQPNGVFFIDSQGAAIVETREYAKAPRSPLLATQSGRFSSMAAGSTHSSTHSPLPGTCATVWASPRRARCCSPFPSRR